MSTLIYKTVQFVKNECDEHWKPEHDAVMQQYDDADCLSDAARLYASLFTQVKHAIEGRDQDTFDEVLSLCATLDLWYGATCDLLERIELLENDEFQVEVECADKLRDCHREAAAMLEELRDATTAIEAVREGRSISLQEFLDELRHPVHGR